MKAKEAKRQTLLELVEYACLPCVGDFRGDSFEASLKTPLSQKQKRPKESLHAEVLCLLMCSAALRLRAPARSTAHGAASRSH